MTQPPTIYGPVMPILASFEERMQQEATRLWGLREGMQHEQERGKANVGEQMYVHR